MLLEAAYAEAAVAGRLRQPLSYVAADKRLQDQHDYLDEVCGEVGGAMKGKESRVGRGVGRGRR